MKKIVGIIYGGQSFEHEVSKMTKESIVKNIDRELFDIQEIYIDKKGKFDKSLLNNIDVAFLAVHGPNCEDGKLQKYLDDQGIKYTGAGVEASKINMDKIKEHQLFEKAGLKVTEYMFFNNKKSVEDIIESFIKFGFPVFVKPNNGGSSVGISKANNIGELKQSLKESFKYDTKVIVEKSVENHRELELAVLGNNDLIISDPGEILSNGKFYSYISKYFQPFKTDSRAKNLSKTQIEKIKKMAETAYRCTKCQGYARVDFLLDQNGEIYINEINTLPGFTKISMFPKLMQELGITYKDLITRIINLAFEK